MVEPERNRLRLRPAYAQPEFQVRLEPVKREIGGGDERLESIDDERFGVQLLLSTPL
jgi:hypothetical protein